MRKSVLAYAKTKTQISCAVTAQLISAFIFAAQKYYSSFIHIENFKLLPIFCDYTGRFVSDLVGNPKDQFSRFAAHINFYIEPPHGKTNNLYRRKQRRRSALPLLRS